jgi:pilus assembly protein Flp/PilA
MFTTIRQLLKDETGVTAIEYGLIAALIAVVGLAGIPAIGTKLAATFTTIGNSLTTQ